MEPKPKLKTSDKYKSLITFVARPHLHSGHRRAGREEHQEDRPQVQLHLCQAALSASTRGATQGETKARPTNCSYLSLKKEKVGPKNCSYLSSVFKKK